MACVPDPNSNMKGDDHALLASKQARQVTDAPGSREPGDIFWRCNSPLFVFLLAALFGR